MQVPTGLKQAKTLPSPPVSGNLFPGLSFCRRAKSHKMWSSVLRWLLLAGGMLVLQSPPCTGAAASLVLAPDGLHGDAQVAPPCAGAAVADGPRLPIRCFEGDASGAPLLRAC